MVASVSSAKSANSTPISWARSAGSARSAPESCTVAIPPPRERRPAENSSSVSVNSAMSLTCTAPVAAQNACHAACSPASAPECAATMARPRGEPPMVRITTGTSCSAARSKALPQPRDGPRRLHQQRDDAGLRVIERVVHVVGGVGDEFLAGRHREPEAEPAPGPQQCRERRAGMGDQADSPGLQRIWLQVPERPHAERVVDEPHAARAAQRHPGIGSRRRDLFAQPVRRSRTAPPTAPRRPPRIPAAPPAPCRARRAGPGRPPPPGLPASARMAPRRCGRSEGSPDAHAPNRVGPR